MTKQKEKTAALPGRPPKMKGGHSIKLYLSSECVEIAKKLGNGNVSEGVRFALTRFFIK